MPTNPLLLDLTGSQLLGVLLASRPPTHAVVETNQKRLGSEHDGMTITRSAVEQVCATLKSWMGQTHFLIRRMNNFKTEISLSALDYKQKRMMAILDPEWLVDVVRLPAQRPVLRFGTR